ncbi:MAG: hypothetical protein PHX08_07800 [Lachnospiraceae bacterium]|nr:hypothetical protein [Lachnospiraceae bacterium]
MAKKKNRATSVVRENVSETEKLLVKRINETLEASGMNKSKYAENLGWGLSKLSRILSGTTGVSVTNGSDMAQALGYPLEAFIQEDFNLAEYERTHEYKIMTLRECISGSLDWLEHPDSFKECILRQFPRTLRKMLSIDTDKFLVSGELNEKKETFINTEGGFTTVCSFVPQITARYKNIVSKGNDFLSVGYWFDEGRNYLALSICYVPDKENFSTYGVNKRNYYKSLIKGEEVGADISGYKFSDELLAGEIFTRLYDFESSKMDEETLVSDLEKMFEEYKKLVDSSVKAVDQTFWDFYNKVVTESGPKIEITQEVLTRQIEAFVGNERRSSITRSAAIETANFTCEVCGAKTTFTDKNGNQYFEAHYLIPLEQRELTLDYSTDVQADAICLCPNCHKKIHYGADKDREEMVVDLYYKRKQLLSEAGINVSLAQLLKMYNIQ